MTAADPARRTLSRSLMLSYGVGAVSIGINQQILVLVLLFYNQVVGLPPALAGLALAISLFVDAVWDPLVGQWSDRHVSRLGRRHPFLYGAAVPVAASFVALWNPPVGLSHPALFAWLLATILAYRLTTSLYEVPNHALAPELVKDYDGRNGLMGVRYVFQTLGGALAMTLAYGVFLRETPANPLGQLSRPAYVPLSIALAVALLGFNLLSAWGTRSVIPQLHRPSRTPATVAQVMREMAATLTNRNFVVLLVSGLLSGMGIGMHTGLLIYLNTYFWELPASRIFVLMVTGLVISPFASLISPAVSRRVGKRNGCMALFFISIVAYAAPVFLRLVGLFPANDSPWLLPTLTAVQAFTNLTGTAGYILSYSMQADIVEESQVATGRRSEGLLLAANTLLQKIVTSLATVIPGMILAAVAFPAHALPGHVPAEVLRHLGWLYLPLTCGLSCLSVAVIGFYRLDRDAHRRNLAALSETEVLVAPPPGAGPEAQPARYLEA